MGIITFESFPEGADLEIEGEPCGQTPAEIETTCDLLSFRENCMGAGVVVCEWSTLETWLMQGTVGDIWWDLTDDERYSIADTTVKSWTSELAASMIPYVRSGEEYCAGGNGTWKIAQCLPNAIIRYSQFGEQCESTSACYYRKSSSDDEEYCYCEKKYNLPTHLVGCQTPPGADPGFGHALTAIQIKQSIDELASYYFFQYANWDIQPGEFHIPIMDYDELNLTIESPHSISCTGYISNTITTFHFTNGELI